MRKELFLLWVILILVGGCERKVEIDPETVKQMIIHRNLGLAYLEENKLRDAANEFQTLIQIAPKEPLGYADLGLSYLRMTGELEQSEKWLREALNLEPDHPDIRLLLAKVYELTDRKNQAIRILEETLDKHPYHVRTLFQLAQYTYNAEDSDTRQKAENHLNRVVNTLPANVAARLRLIELLLRNGKPGQTIQHMETIRQILPKLPEGSVEIFKKSLELMRNESTGRSIVPILMFHNIMKPTPFYQASIAELRGTGGPVAGAPIRRFSQVVSMPIQEQTGIPDALGFTDVTAASGLDIGSSGDLVESNDGYPRILLAHGDYDNDGDQDIFVSRWLSKEVISRQYLFANDRSTFSDIADEVGISHPGRDMSALFADFDNDGYLDLFITNTLTNRLYHNTGEGKFKDVTPSTGIRTDPESRSAMFVDIDHEGDLDLFIATGSGNRLYRNNSDGTFTDIADEAGISGEKVIPKSRDTGFGDFDNDGDIDLIVVNQDGVLFYDNLRQGYFRDITPRTGLVTEGRSGAVAVGDYNNDGYPDVFVTDLTGNRHSLFRNLGDGSFERDTGSDSTFEPIRDISGLDATFFDADNDGFLDILFTGTPKDPGKKHGGLRLFHNNGQGEYLDASALLPEHTAPGSQVEVTDYDNDGDQDIFLAGLNNIHLFRNDGGNVNNYLVVRLTGLRTGSGKNNYFGIGAKVEVKAGTLYQMRVMNEPIAHFGLGNRESADVVRIVWSNGVPQNRFNPERNQTIVENQVLKGSCPWLYTWNGEKYEFATDVLWASALGMPLGIMGREVAYAFAQSTDEYLKIQGDKLLPKNGRYSLQFTSELWETPYLDRVKLLVIDHPDSVDIFVDEKFTPPPYSPFRIYGVGAKQPPVSAYDRRGNDVLRNITGPDGKYVSNLVPLQYQGITELHDLILDLGDLSNVDSVFLFLYGWIFPTDASINMNIAQGNRIHLVPPSLQVIDEQGNWKTVMENTGFPKGKNKTMVIDLTGRFLTDDYRVRIRTNMQIYWDHIFYTTKLYSNRVQIASLKPVLANLHYRGFSKITRESQYSPHIPDYRTVTAAPKWRDLTGMYTGYGNVLSLLLESDSKYVIMNAGDEITLEFDAKNGPDLPQGWSRDYIFYNDGWLKDGDLNTAYGQKVEPLPFHGMNAYPYGTDVSYPGDEEHTAYLKTYNNRKVTTEEFKRSLFNMEIK